MDNIFDKSPIFWLGHLTTGVPKPWEHFDIEAVMLNAFDILTHKKNYNEIIEIGIKKFLNFDGPVMIDSGGFLFLKKKDIPISIEELASIYNNINADYFVSLDHPLNLKISDSEQTKRIKNTIKNFDELVNLKDSNFNVIPVIHGYNKKQIRKCISSYENISDFSVVGIGSLVPLMFPYTVNKWKKLVDLINIVKEEIPDKHLHIFGAGNSVTMMLFYSIGVDSIDSMAWRKKAAHGMLQFPGIGQRFIKKLESKSWTKQLDWDNYHCDCPICKNKNPHALLEDLHSSFSDRALHNAWVFQQEAFLAKEHIKRGDFDDFVDQHIKGSALHQVYSYSKTLKYNLNYFQ